MTRFCWWARKASLAFLSLTEPWLNSEPEAVFATSAAAGCGFFIIDEFCAISLPEAEVEVIDWLMSTSLKSFLMKKE